MNPAALVAGGSDKRGDVAREGDTALKAGTRSAKVGSTILSAPVAALLVGSTHAAIGAVESSAFVLAGADGTDLQGVRVDNLHDRASAEQADQRAVDAVSAKGAATVRPWTAQREGASLLRGAQLVAVAVGDREAAVAAEGAGRDLDARGRLAPFVLVAVD